MKRPLFEIGEIVILQSVSIPELNGEYTVRQVVTKGDKYSCRLSGKVKVCGVDAYYYFLHEVIADSPVYPGTEAPWLESALRKKHKGCGEDFQSMINTLKSPVKEGV